MTGAARLHKMAGMKKIVVTGAMVVLAALALSGAALGQTDVDN